MPELSWTSPEIPDRTDCVLRYVLERRAAETPDKVFILFEDGSTWTYADTLKIARRAGAALQSYGIGIGDHVLSWLPNGPDALKVWFGANYIGAVYAAINLAYRGRLLEHVIGLTGAKVAVIHEDLLDRLEGIDLAKTETILVSGSATGRQFPVQVESTSVFDRCSDIPVLAREIEPWDPQFLLFTSGTTGPSKGAIVTYVQHHMTCMVSFEEHLSAEDRYMVNMPLFHGSGTTGVFGMMLLGASCCIVSYFQTDAFLDVVRKSGTTACVMLGAVASFLNKKGAKPDDADNPLRLAFMLPLLPNTPEFARRFGIDVVTMYSMSEISVPLVSEVNTPKWKSCGRPRAGIEARLVGDFDREVPIGEVGELILRASRPWSISPGYFGMTEASLEAWRNGWFHTGDLMRRDDAGDYYFVDRKKDALRRRGENISSFEVESEIVAHPAVREAAVIAIPSPHAEDDVMAIISLAENEKVSHDDLFKFLQPRMAHFMLPRYIRIIDELPKTPSLRVQKHILRTDGVTTDTWDREAAGITIKREHIGR